MPKTRKPDTVKDSFVSLDDMPMAGRTDRMVPEQGTFTRPRRFGRTAHAEAPVVIEQAVEMVVPARAEAGELTTAPRDLWNLLHLSEPGKDQHILAGSQAEEDFRATDVSRAFDLLRSRLRQTVKQHNWVNVAVVSPTAGCGNTFSAANLAASLSRVPSSRTVLMDFNMRTPGLAGTLDMNASETGDLADFLASDVAITEEEEVRRNGHGAA